jgi:DNA gyrase inhibitor GyrI
MKMKITMLSILITVCMFLPLGTFAYEEAYGKTSVGEIEIKMLPPSTVLMTTNAGTYFDGDNRMFGTLFRYIQKNNVAMTVPVQADIEPAAMMFFVGSDDIRKNLNSEDGVVVKQLPTRLVASRGIRGSYSEKNYEKARQQLAEWCATNGSVQVAGAAYAVYWNGPYVPGIMKRAEVHIPISTNSAAVQKAVEAAPPESKPEEEATSSAPRYTDDMTEWPNAVSHANSDRWIVDNHDAIRVMKPRLLVLNFANGLSNEEMVRKTEKLIAAIHESSRYHGYKDPDAPPFLQYQVFKYVDLRDPGKTTGSSSRAPKKRDRGDGTRCNYDGFFSDQFAASWGVPDPEQPRRFLNLAQLVDKGYVHEVWFFADCHGDWKCLESVEMKPVYDEQFNRVSNQFRQAGNGGDRDQRWIGRSLRLNCLNWERGIGCGMENLGHSMEGMAHSRVIPYFTRYFYEYAMFDLDKTHDLPFNSYYRLWGTNYYISYPDPSTAVITYRDTIVLSNYVAGGGNVHFTPNARDHYDQDNTNFVMSTIEDWRIGSGPDGSDRAEPWSNEKIARYKDMAPDCQGRWLVYWRQNMPGLDNKSKDDAGKPMKNWFPFLFY